jgi:hypothetical protein
MAKNTPDNMSRIQSDLFSFPLMTYRHAPIGSSINTVSSIRYIAMIDAGAVDHLTKIAEKDTEMTPTVSKRYGDIITDFRNQELS